MPPGKDAFFPRLADLPVNLWLVGQEGLETQRQGRYLPAAIRSHPGKMRPALARRLIETFSRPGDWLLDPMSGIGTTGVEAVHLGRHYVGIELEARFVAWQRRHLQQARAHGAPGSFAIISGDARRLDADFPRAAAPTAGSKVEPAGKPLVDTVIVSPPYGNRLDLPPHDGASPYVRRLLQEKGCRSSFVPPGYGAGQENVGNLQGEAYFQAMRPVYAGCFQVLRPRGLLVIVMQPNRRGPLLLPLHHETTRLCQELGFEFLDEIVSVLGRVDTSTAGAARLLTQASFWRRLLIARLLGAGWPVTLNQLEYVLVFRKPDEAKANPTTKAASRPPLPARHRVVKSEMAMVA